MWIIGVHFQVYSTWIRWILCEECHLNWFTCFPHVFFTWIIGVGPPIHGYHVMFEPRFPSDVYSMWVFHVDHWCTRPVVILVFNPMASYFQPQTSELGI